MMETIKSIMSTAFFYCPYVEEIREKFRMKMLWWSPYWIQNLLSSQTLSDPSADIYRLLREYEYNLHKKYEKYYGKSHWSLHNQAEIKFFVRICLILKYTITSFIYCEF